LLAAVIFVLVTIAAFGVYEVYFAPARLCPAGDPNCRKLPVETSPP
jgi:hypothetical protein